MAAKTPEHGTRPRYRAGCRCAKCRAWKTKDQAEYRERKRAAAAGEPVAETVPAPEVRARPTREKRPTAEPETRPVERARPTGPVIVSVGAPDFDEQVREAFSVRRPQHDDRLAQIIDDALFESRGDESTAAVVAAERIRDEGWRPLQGAVERAMRKALGAAADDMTALRHEVVLRGARVLDDPDAGRNYKSTVDAIRAVLADLKDAGGGAADAAAAIMAAIRGTGGSGDAAPVGDPA